MPPRRVLSLLALLLPMVTYAAGALSAQTAPPPRRSCSAAEHRQFDFWVGEWEVTLPNGSRAGSNRIEPILGGCALRETWSGTGGSDGTSYNAFDASRKRWHQTWVDNQGTVLVLEGAFSGGKMRLEGETLDTAGRTQRQRITWETTAPGRVRQLWESSSDGGATWTVAFDGRYVKR